jgi:hypothetical protein
VRAKKEEVDSRMSLYGRAGQSALKQVKAYPLSDTDIRKVLGSNIKIWNYPQLGGLERVEQMFDDQGRAIILYPNSGPSSGHWCCLINKRNGIHYFDSYGEEPEEPKDDVLEENLKEWGADYPDLLRLLKGSGRPVFYNTHKFQSEKADVATCGRHCCARLLYAPATLDQYAKVIKKSGLTADEFVSGLVFDKLGK